MADNANQGSLLGKIAAYTELLDKDPYSTIFVPLSEAYRQMGMLDDAVGIAKKGIMQNPAFPPGYVAHGRGLAQQGLSDEAAAEFDKALTLDRKNLAALKSLAKIRIQRGRLDEARKLLDQARGIKPDDGSVIKLLSVLARQMETVARPSVVGIAEKSAGEAEPSGTSAEPISTATIAEIYIRQGFPEKALKVYRDLLRADPQNGSLREKLIALKERLADVGLEELIPDMITAPAVVKLESSPFETVPDAAIAASDMTGTNSADESAGRSIAHIFANWLDSISKRREAHVQ
ncbi:MAG: hypothetical protein A2X84_11990 [Desulfuromonadaceae bacterium GWC2_58_13]|nr:MAG: hypothetical protein A2X84_11990 [Desulfuromonadaceae bacterium GWC2_58_13]